MKIKDRNLFIESSLNFLRIHGCFPSIILMDINQSIDGFNSVKPHDILWHEIIPDNANGDISRICDYLDSMIIQRNGKRMMNSTIIPNSFYYNKYHDTDLVRYISKSLSDISNTVIDHSIEICNYLDKAAITNLTYMFNIDKLYACNILIIDGFIMVLESDNDYHRFMRKVIDIVTIGRNIYDCVRHIAYSKYSMCSGEWDIGNVCKYHIQYKKDIVKLVAYIRKKFNNAIEIKRSDML